MRLAAFLIAVLLSWAAEAPAQTVQDLCNRATMTAAANGTVTAEAFVYGSAERYVCTYTPSTFIDDSVHPLLIALHGGSGNASQMMEDSHGIIATAEAMGAIALFPNGRPGPKLLLQQVAEPKAGKNRMHLDIEVPDIEPEAERLVALGATRVQDETLSEHGTTWVLMTDPEGNEFCVCDAGQPGA